MASNGETLYKFVPEADRVDPESEWQRMITFTTTENEKIEMPRFETFDDALALISENALWRTGDRKQALDSWFQPGKYVFGHPVEIQDFKITTKLTSPETGKIFVLIGLYQLGNGSALLFEDKNSNFKIVYVNVDWNEFWQKALGVSTPQP